MPTRPPAESVRRARGFNWYKPKGLCMRFTWECIDGVTAYGLADANAGWARSTDRRTDKHPPAGVPVYWAGGSHGHIALSVGGGRVRSTDWPRLESVGECTIDQLSRSWGITYRGWAPNLAGTPIPGLPGSGSGSGDREPPPIGEDDMTPQQAKQLSDLLNATNALAKAEANRYDVATRRYADLVKRIERLEKKP